MPWRSESDFDKGSGDWSLYSKVHHRLALLDSPHPDGWTCAELAEEYDCTVSWMARILQQLVADRNALLTREGRYIGP